MTSNDRSRQRRFTVQNCTYNHGLLAVQTAAEDKYECWDELRPRLEEDIPFNSLTTRKRRVRSLFRWAFQGGDLNSLGVKVWRAYRDEDLTRQVLRERYLDAYPILGRFVSSIIASLPAGSELHFDTTKDYLSHAQVGALKDSISKLRSTMRDMGFIYKFGTKYLVSETLLPGTSFLILLHYHLARQPDTIPVQEIVGNPFWQYLGGTEVSEVRSALSHAAANDAISRYATVDSLEQVSTRFSLDEFLERRVKLDS